MDELDAVFDSWEKHKQQAERVGPSQKHEGDPGLSGLTTALAAAQLAALPALMNHAPTLGTPRWAAALEGCLVAAAANLRDLEQLRQIDIVRQAIRTQKGKLRKRLSTTHRERIARGVAELSLVHPDDADPAVEDFLSALSKVDDLSPGDVHDLFACGIHRADQLLDGDSAALSVITGLGEHKLRALRAALEARTGATGPSPIDVDQ